jgi:predicted DNA-binding ribbon-helix-helix protein
MARRTDRRLIQTSGPGTEVAAPMHARSAIRPVKRSFRIAGHPTSISLEAVFWEALKAAATARGMTQAQLVASIDATRGATNLSSAVRVWLFQDLQRRAADPALAAGPA